MELRKISNGTASSPRTNGRDIVIIPVHSASQLLYMRVYSCARTIAFLVQCTFNVQGLSGTKQSTRPTFVCLSQV